MGIEDEGSQESNSRLSIKPKCSICLQVYSNRTYTRPCFHSFCFHCICQWINTASTLCPICRQTIDSFVYNINEEKETFSEYFLKDKGNRKLHEPPLRKKNYVTYEQKKRIERKQMYEGHLHVLHYPEPLDKHRQLTVIEPQHIPRSRIFLQRELRIILTIDEVDEFVLQHMIQLLLLPFEQKWQTMYDPSYLQMVAEWLNNKLTLAKKLIDELLAFIKSGLSYEQFITTIEYNSINQQK
ncbi:hypothetical protein BDF20DRAFT_451254 [Mycotypha africana]|uniref:uncharacterized protein n=1 Tax=Mycotypha africana TaxID=64632 RepID=UPI002300A7F2|nr:uncharacterized protein BDF20DRAFT_451254 [Mycotypha africana]KAI8982097.1 hypothetical protein BDF20DRAFT_451254 [Mycotypha africana]